MQTQKQNAQQDITPAGERIIAMEKATLEAFKNKDAAAFTKNFADDYIGIANDGVKNAQGEIEGMRRLELSSLSLTEEQVSFPSADICILTYKMVVKGTLNGKDISGAIYSSSTYLKREDAWVAILHTESKGQ